MYELLLEGVTFVVGCGGVEALEKGKPLVACDVDGEGSRISLLMGGAGSSWYLGRCLGLIMRSVCLV